AGGRLSDSDRATQLGSLVLWCDVARRDLSIADPTADQSLQVFFHQQRCGTGQERGKGSDPVKAPLRHSATTLSGPYRRSALCAGGCIPPSGEPGWLGTRSPPPPP